VTRAQCVCLGAEFWWVPHETGDPQRGHSLTEAGPSIARQREYHVIHQPAGRNELPRSGGTTGRLMFASLAKEEEEEFTVPAACVD
jgi:hypothetical protein